MNNALTKTAHTAKDSSGRFSKTALCDCCNKPVGTDHFSDEETCGQTDGLGFFLCDRKRCMAKRDALDAAGRLELYKAAHAAR